MSEKERTISASTKLCVLLFSTALAAASDTSSIDGIGTQLADQSSRFKVWSANIGAYRTGPSSLEYKLRDASNIRRSLLDLLQSLEQLLQDYTAIVKGEVTPWDEFPDEEDSIPDLDMPETELGQIHLHVKEVVDNLLGLSITIKNPAPHDRIMVATATNVSFYEQHDINHVREKYGELEPWQAEKLGRAISRRRQYFRYRQTHHEKLAFGAEQTLDEKAEKAAPSTFASSMRFSLKDGGMLDSERDDKLASDMMSQTSFATSANQDLTRRIPSLPKEAEDGLFECPLCYFIITAKNRTEWKRHVFEDLRPYVCIHQACADIEHEYAHRRDWINHTQHNHWIKYSCPWESCSHTFTSPTFLREHLETVHPDGMSVYSIDTLISLARESTKDAADMVCPFCRAVQHSVLTYHRHVGRHMEQLCLFALPAHIVEDEVSRTPKVVNIQAGSDSIQFVGDVDSNPFTTTTLRDLVSVKKLDYIHKNTISRLGGTISDDSLKQLSRFGFGTSDQGKLDDAEDESAGTSRAREDSQPGLHSAISNAGE